MHFRQETWVIDREKAVLTVILTKLYTNSDYHTAYAHTSRMVSMINPALIV